MPGQTAITIGNFDGLHAGHAALIHRARQLATPEGTVKALAFYPHPLTKLAPHRAPEILTPLDEKTRLAGAAGADEVVILAPEPDLLTLSPQDFIAKVAEDHAPNFIVEGADFHFGAKRAGSPQTLKDLAAKHNYQPVILPDVEVELADQSLVRASSTIARWLIANGRVQEARRVLARPYRLLGTVQPGAKRGRDLGFRTANLATHNLAPAEGVYAATAILPSGDHRPAALSVGTNPTFTTDGAPLSVEAHILDWDGASAPDYGYTLALDLHEWIREQRVYSTPTPLITQIERDVEAVRAICAQTRELTA